MMMVPAGSLVAELSDVNIARNLPGFEEATRALFAQNVAGLEQYMANWPDDIREHALMLAADALHH